VNFSTEIIRTHGVHSFHAYDGFLVRGEVHWRSVAVEKERAGSAVRTSSNHHLINDLQCTYVYITYLLY